MSLSFDTINSFNVQVVQKSEDAMAALITTMNNKGADVTTADLLSMQTNLQKWTMTTDIQSTITKQLGDALKGIIQKAG